MAARGNRVCAAAVPQEDAGKPVGETIVTEAMPLDVQSWLDRQRLSGLQIAVAVLCGAAVTLDGFDSQIIGFVAPALIQEFKVAPAALATTFSAGLAGILVGCLALAPLADWIGRRWLVIASVGVFAIATLFAARAASLRELEVLRFAAGIGLGACMPNALALTSEYAPARLRSTLTAWMFTGFSLGALLGGLLASQLVPLVGWRPLLLVGGVAPLALCLAMLALLPESVRHLTLTTTAHARIASILKRIHDDPIIARSSSFHAGEERGGGFTLPHLFDEGRAGGTLILWAAFFLMLFDVFLLASWTPVVLASAGLPRETAVLTGAIQQAGSVAATLLLGPLFDRFGFYRSLIPVLLAAAVGVVFMGVMSADTPIRSLGAFVAGAGIMGGQTALIVIAGAFYPTFIRATGTGWGLGVGRVGAIVGPLVGGWMIAAHWTPQEIFMLAGAPPVCAAGLLLALRASGLRRTATREALVAH